MYVVLHERGNQHIIHFLGFLHQEDWNALQFTCSIGDAEVTKTLLSDGASPDFQTKVSTTIYWSACFHCK